MSRFVRMLVSLVAGFVASAFAAGAMEAMGASDIAFGSRTMLGLWMLCSGLCLVLLSSRARQRARRAPALPVVDVRPRDAAAPARAVLAKPPPPSGPPAQAGEAPRKAPLPHTLREMQQQYARLYEQQRRQPRRP